MALKAVWLDIGETLVDERGYWRKVAEGVGLPEHVVVAALGVTIAHGEHHRALYGHLGVEPPEPLPVYDAGDFYPDALPCLAELKARGWFVGVAGNQSAELEAWFAAQGTPVDAVASSARWGVEKPSSEFFARIVTESRTEPAEIAYVGDRVDNDVEPANAAGFLSVHVRRGPWGYLQDPARADIRVDSLAELPDRLASYA